jgi:2-oxo-4-hydroxy-4-carboxy-5-ureidoimidazoline decarboxylase
MNLHEINNWNIYEAREAFRRCCGSTRWACAMEYVRPFKTVGDVLGAAEQIWWGLQPADWLEAFACHPEIGCIPEPSTDGASTAAWSRREQSGLRGAAADVVAGLYTLNRRYKARFGHIFIVCATGKSGEDMLEMLERRLKNAPEVELHLAAYEQYKITRIRLDQITS